MIMNMVGGGGGLEDINGHISDFVVTGESIKAGDFVQFNTPTAGATTQLSTTQYSKAFGLTELEDGRVILLRTEGNNVLCSVCTLENNVFTIKKNTTLYSVSSASNDNYGDLILLSNNYVLSIYDNEYADIVRVSLLLINSDNSVTVCKTQDVSVGGSAGMIITKKVNSSRVCFTYAKSDGAYIVIINISGNSFSIDYNNLINGGGAKSIKNMHNIGNNKLLVVYGDSSSHPGGSCFVATVNQSNVSYGTTVQNAIGNIPWGIMKGKYGNTIHIQGRTSANCHHYDLIINNDNTITVTGGVYFTNSGDGMPSSNGGSYQALAEMMIDGSILNVGGSSTDRPTIWYTNNEGNYKSANLNSISPVWWGKKMLVKKDGACLVVYTAYSGSSSSSTYYRLHSFVMNKPTVSLYNGRFCGGVALTGGSNGNTIKVMVLDQPIK